MTWQRVRPALPALLIEMLPVWCAAGIGALLGLLLLAEQLELTDEVYVPPVLAMICLGFGTLAGGIGWFMRGEQRIGVLVAGRRRLTVLALLYLVGQGFKTGTSCSIECGYAGKHLGDAMLLLFISSPLVSSAVLLALVLAEEPAATHRV